MHSEYYINIYSWFWCWCWVGLTVLCFLVELGSIGAGFATVSGDVIEGSFIGAQSDVVYLSALRGIIWIYFFRNWASLAKLAIWVELRSIGAAIDRLAVVIYFIQITLSLALLAPSACPIVKLQSTKHASLTDDRVIDHLLLA